MIKKSFYRTKALEHYQQSQVPKVVPKFTSSFITFLFWVISILLVIGVLFVWSYSPNNVEHEPGVLLNVAAKTLPDYGLTKEGADPQTIGIVFLPAPLKTLFQAGNIVQVQPGETQYFLSGKIARIDTTTRTVDQARVLYHLNNQLLSEISSPVVMAFILFNATKADSHDTPKRVTANVQVHIPGVLHLFFVNLKLPGT